MRAYVVEHPEEAFTQVDLPRPVPSAGRVLVRVHASGVNPLDTKIQGQRLTLPSLPSNAIPATS